MVIDKYKLRKNTFLVQSFDVRHKWAKPYFASIFCAKQTSTQRSESANHLLKSYVSAGSAMHIFLKQYQKMQFDRAAQHAVQGECTTLAAPLTAQEEVARRRRPPRGPCPVTSPSGSEGRGGRWRGGGSGARVCLSPPPPPPGATQTRCFFLVCFLP